MIPPTLLLPLLAACSHPADTGDGEPWDTGIGTCLDTQPAYADCTGESVKEDQDGGVTETEEHVWDDAGNEVYSERYVEGEPTLQSTWVWDEEGRLLSQASGVLGGEVDSEYTYVWEGDLLLELTWVYAYYPEQNFQIWYTYDDAGQLVLTEVDRGEQDGVIDDTTAYTWADGNVVRWERDVGADGTIDMVTTQTWEEGRLVRVEEDRDGDGSVDSVCTTAWAFSGHDSIATETCTGSGPATVEVIRTDAHGEVVSDELDGDGDGYFEGRITYDRDERCLLQGSRTQSPLDEDSLLTETDDFTYTPEGRVVREAWVQTLVTGGETEQYATFTSWAYTCPSP